jgi:hypothetical protein
MGYTKSTSKAATALDYAQIDHFNSGSNDPFDSSWQNVSKFQDQSLKGKNSGGYRLQLGLNELPTPEINMNLPEQNISREALGMEKMVGANFENKDMFEQNQMATRSFNPAESMISASPDFSVPLDDPQIRDYNNQNDKLGGLVTGLS